MGTVKDRNSMDLTEAEDTKKWQEYTEELYKKDLNEHDKPRTKAGAAFKHSVKISLSRSAFSAKKWRKAVERERLEISSRKLERPRERFMQRWAQ